MNVRMREMVNLSHLYPLVVATGGKGVKVVEKKEGKASAFACVCVMYGRVDDCGV